MYEPVAELKRQGLPNESWKISRINDGYELCDTYPQVLGIPKLVTDEDIRESAKFRSKVSESVSDAARYLPMARRPPGGKPCLNRARHN